jgi:ubiquitin carboxyl-terminal hydrolase 5/13
MFKNLVGKGHPEFSSNRQQDSAEYLQYLFTHIQVALSYLAFFNLSIICNQKAEKSANLSDLTKAFEFTTVTKLKCQSCHGVKLRETKVTELRLPLPFFGEDSDAKANFYNMLESIQAEEEVNVNCPNCKTNKPFTKKTFIKTFPKYLVAVVQRFMFDNWVPKKNDTLFDAPEEAINLETLKMPALSGNDVIMQDEDNGGEDESSKVDQGALAELEGVATTACFLISKLNQLFQ